MGTPWALWVLFSDALTSCALIKSKSMTRNNIQNICSELISSSSFFSDSLKITQNAVHSPSKCLVWVKKCRHVWLDQNFDLSFLTNKLWLVFMGKKKRKIIGKKIQNGFQNLFMKFLWFGPWVSRIDWCKGHWCSSTYMAVRLSDISLKMA